MTEFRWFVQKYETENGGSGMAPPVLQYRVKYDPQITAGLGPHYPSGRVVWSDWLTIPVVVSNDVAYV